MSHKFKRRILFDQFMQPKTDFLNVGIRLRLDCKGQDSAWKHRFRVTNGSMFITEGISRLRVFEFADGHDIPCPSRRDGRMFLPHQSVEVSALLFAGSRTVEDHRVCVKSPRQDSQIRQPTNKWVD